MRFATFAAAALLLVATLTAHADDASSPPELGSDDPALQQRVAADEALGSGQVVVDQGHVDLGPRFVDGTFPCAELRMSLNGGNASLISEHLRCCRDGRNSPRSTGV